MKLPLLFLLLLAIGYAQQPALPDTICEIAPLPEVEIRAEGGNPAFTTNAPVITSISGRFIHHLLQARIPRKYDTNNELIFMYRSDVWMADPSARTGE